ncbi:uncharacterized protein [Apostichopus japonicus]
MLTFKCILMMATVLCCCCIRQAQTRACATPQYARIGQAGVIQCSFSTELYAIYWYSTLDSSTTPPIVHRVNSTTPIEASDNNGFGLSRNGSLVISKVTMSHDKDLRVLYSAEKLGGSFTEDIDLIVTVPPPIGYPLIDKCNGKRICFTQISSDDSLSCSVNGSKPAVSLIWSKGNTDLQSENDIFETSPLYTSHVQVNNIPFEGNLLQLLSCKANDTLSLLAKRESFLLVEDINGSISPDNIIKKNVEVGSHVELLCPNGRSAESLIWKAATLEGNSTMIAKVIDTYFIIDESVNRKEDSLVIPVALVTHTGLYMCVYNDGMHEEMLSYQLYVFVKPANPYPLIANCIDDEVCRATLDEDLKLSCSVTRTRPAVDLRWVHREGTTEQALQSTKYNFLNQFYYTSFANTTVSSTNKYAMILACVPDNDENLMVPDEAFILVENSRYEALNHTKANVKWVQIHTELQLDCGKIEGDYLIWKRKTSATKTYESLLYRLHENEDITNTRFEIREETSLVLPRVTVDDEGTYLCVSGDGAKEIINLYNVQVYVNPTPEYLVVDGCENQQYCVLRKDSTGNLTCSVHGIRPDVNLEWKTVHETSESKITFYDREVTRHQNGATFKVVLKSKFRLKLENVDRVSIECRTAPPLKYDFSLQTTLDLLFNDLTSSTGGFPTTLKIILAIIVVVIVVASAAVIFLCLKKRLKLCQSHENERDITFELKDEEQPLNHQTSFDSPDSPDCASNTYQELLDQFTKELAYKYKDWCAQIQPLPTSSREGQYEVGKIFVDRALKCSENGRYSENWSRLNSYNDIFKQDSKRIIIEADPGYGKSTMILQAAKDWYSKDSTSSLKDVEIFILLRLKMLQGITSFYKAVKTTLLPKDTRLLESHIEFLLFHCKSVVVALDDYDEYPDKEKDSDFMKILKGDMLQNCKVILLTRISILPEDYHATTQFMQLNGFSDESQSQYIAKMFGNPEGFSLKELIKDLPIGGVIRDILTVPLFFTMLAHINHFLDQSHQKEDITSVTALFKIFIPILEGRLKLKMDKHTSHIEESETLTLGKAALYGLIEQKEGKVWQKSSLIKEIGESCYQKFVKVGILVEENKMMLDISVLNNQKEIEERVKFYHIIFCQWYAAVYLTKYLRGSSLLYKRENILKKLNPFDLQYLYRFTCGSNERAADKVIKYLESGLYGDEFALLCTLEKTGSVDDIKDQIKDMCNETVSFFEPSSRLLRKSTALLVEIASTEKIPIECILIDRCYALVEEYSDHLGMSSGMTIPPLATLKELIIYGVSRRLTVRETENIFLYVSKCDSLTELSLQKTFQPYEIDDDNVWAALQDKAKHTELTIKWSPFKDETHILDIDSKRWKTSPDDKFLTEEDYKNQSTRYGT